MNKMFLSAPNLFELYILCSYMQRRFCYFSLCRYCSFNCASQPDSSFFKLCTKTVFSQEFPCFLVSFHVLMLNSPALTQLPSRLNNTKLNTDFFFGTKTIFSKSVTEKKNCMNNYFFSYSITKKNILFVNTLLSPKVIFGTVSK